MYTLRERERIMFGLAKLQADMRDAGNLDGAKMLFLARAAVIRHYGANPMEQTAEERTSRFPNSPRGVKAVAAAIGDRNAAAELLTAAQALLPLLDSDVPAVRPWQAEADALRAAIMAATGRITQ